MRLPLSVVDRHGLVAGATGTGKTKTLQILAGQLSDAGVPVFVADVKGDLTGISQPGDPSAEPIVVRAEQEGRGGLAADAKDIGVGVVRDLLTTADGRRTLRTVFGALFTKK